MGKIKKIGVLTSGGDAPGNDDNHYFNCNLSYSDNADLLFGRYRLARNCRNAAVGGRGRIAFRA